MLIIMIKKSFLAHLLMGFCFFVLFLVSNSALDAVDTYTEAQEKEFCFLKNCEKTCYTLSSFAADSLYLCSIDKTGQRLALKQLYPHSFSFFVSFQQKKSVLPQQTAAYQFLRIGVRSSQAPPAYYSCKA
jgi:hypothetical protein